MNTEIDYSIVICAYNPDERILKRCLEAVYRLDIDGISMEVILVDNNSLNPLDRIPYVWEYKSKIGTLKLLHVTKQGVKHARMAAIDEAKGKYIVYIDYDNEPEKSYLQELKKLNKQYANVAAWGPGDVTVDFIDGVDKKIEEYSRIAFQERHETTIQSASLPEWRSCYPFGTGLCAHAFLLKEYNKLAKQGQFTVQGRRENELNSGEDTQMVLLCIAKGYFAGVSPTLKLTHIIPAERSNIQYLKRLAYGTGLSYETCLVQIFPDHLEKLQAKILPESKFSRRTVKKYLTTKLSTDPFKIFEAIRYIALHAGAYAALDRPLPPTVKSVIRRMKLV